MIKLLTSAALVGALSLATVPVLTSAAFAQAAGPEPMQGAQPMDNADSGSMEKGSMKKSSMKKKSMKHSKQSMKHKKM